MEVINKSQLIHNLLVKMLHRRAGIQIQIQIKAQKQVILVMLLSFYPGRKSGTYGGAMATNDSELAKSFGTKKLWIRKYLMRPLD
jgi:dTDP-4-amino-4,6-dideoxygalactose transaminase